MAICRGVRRQEAGFHPIQSHVKSATNRFHAEISGTLSKFQQSEFYIFVTISMEHCPASEANSGSAGQDITCLLWSQTTYLQMT
jgi:hypothetical protein